MRFFPTAVAIGAAFVAGHPGEDLSSELQERQDFLLQTRNNLNHCADKLVERQVTHRALLRRSQLVGEHIADGKIMKRQIGSPNESSKSFNETTSLSEIFGGNSSCILSPDGPEGPYFITGESVRSNLTENQQGVKLILDIQIIDTETCEPLEGNYVEVWSTNSTGVYSGAALPGNGVGSSDQSNLNNTWLRGAQKTDADGAVSFTTLFPGHYETRTTHIHLTVHPDTTTFPNGTIFSTQTMFTGQIYFDQELIHAVEAVPPYSTNTQPLTTNSVDSLFNLEALSGSQPAVQYVLLGDSVEDGVLGWISYGVNKTDLRELYAAGSRYESGGVQVQTATNSSGLLAQFSSIIFGAASTPTPTAAARDSEGAASKLLGAWDAVAAMLICGLAVFLA